MGRKEKKPMKGRNGRWLGKSKKLTERSLGHPWAAIDRPGRALGTLLPSCNGDHSPVLDSSGFQ